MRYYKHTMVVGGTGMLREASIEFACRSESLTSIARSAESLETLDEAVSNASCHHLMIAQDYNRISEIRSVVHEAIQEAGPVELLVMWIHDAEGPAPPAICQAASVPGHPVRVAQVLGCAAADPTRSLEALTARLSAIRGIRYQQIILGFHSDSDGSRWLAHEEISNGIISATDGPASLFVVGQVRPWSLRP